jgi:hypothetical protein
MAVGADKSKKFRNRWRVSYITTKRFSDLNYQIQIKPCKLMTVSVNRLKKCHEPPKKRKDRKESMSTPKRNNRLTSGALVMTKRCIY